MPKGIYEHRRKPVRERFLRFWGKTIKPDRGCWLWPGVKDAKGYGRIFLEKKAGTVKIILAHRLAFEIFCKEVPRDIEICHHCDNPPCIRPSHLFAGSHSDNMFDGVRKGSFRANGMNSPRGEQHSNAKLRVKDIKEMRALYSAGNISMQKLAAQFRVSLSLVHGIIRNKRWKLVPGDTGRIRICRKLSYEQYEEIKSRYQNRERPIDLAREFSISATRIIEIGKHGYFGKDNYINKIR